MKGRTYSATERAAEGRSAEESSAVQTPAPEDERIPDFPVDCLPPVLAAQARAISDVCGVPLGMSAPMVLATASASIGRGLRVRSLPGRITPANLYILVSGMSGTGKSLSFKHATAPLAGMQKTLRREFEETVKPRLDADHADLTQQLDELKRSLKGITGEEREQVVIEMARCNAALEKIEKKRAGCLLYVDDVTPEKLAEMMMEQGEGFAHFNADAADQLGIILGTRYGDGKHTSDSLWLKSFTGDPVAISRKNGKSTFLESPCLTVLFVCTPDKVRELFGTLRLSSGGLLPRFLVCDSHARPQPLDEEAEETPNRLPTEAAQPYEASLFAAFERYRISANDDPDEIGLTPGARRTVTQHWNRFSEVAKEGEDSPFAARHTEIAIRIALVLHVFKRAGTALKAGTAGTYNATMHGHEHDLDEQTMRNAITILEWFTAHQNALRAPQRVAADDKAWEKVQALMKDRPHVTARDLYTGHRVCRNAAIAQALLDAWKGERRIESFDLTHEGAGRPTTAYRLAKRPRG
jgi:hypothetical protein